MSKVQVLKGFYERRRGVDFHFEPGEIYQIEHTLDDEVVILIEDPEDLIGGRLHLGKEELGTNFVIIDPKE